MVVLFPQDYRLEDIASAPDSEKISAELRQVLNEQGIRVVRGSRTECEIWFCKQLELVADFKADEQRLYPFHEGQLLGVIHYSRRSSEFRDQQVSSGWYTLRFALQPVDGNHVGTSPTRDFVVLVNSEADSPKHSWEAEQLLTASAEVAGSAHPAMMCLQRAGDGKSTGLAHDEDHDWWVLQTQIAGSDPSGNRPVPISLVVVGHAAE